MASGGLQRRGRERLLGGRRGVDVVASSAKVRAQRAKELRLVVDDEDPASCGNRRRELDERQGEHERRPLAVTRLEPHPAAVRLGEAAGDRKPEARARLVGATCEAVERLEDPLPLRPRGCRGRGR